VASSSALITLFVDSSGRAHGPLEDPNDLAYFLAAAIPLALALSTQGGRGARSRWLVAAAILIFGVLGTLSRGAIAALILLAIWAILRGFVRVWMAVSGALVVVIGIGAVAVLAPQLVHTSLHQKGYVAARNVDTRTLRWNAALRMTADAPLVGLGPAGFRLNYARYEPPGSIDDNRPVVVAHEMYLEVSSELGIPALVAFLGLAVSAFAATRRVALGRSGAGGASFDRTLARGVQGSLIVILSASLFLTEQYYLPLWLMVAAGFALEVRAGRGAP
jgi:putative inorganic carbon (hco3(-)) transporter